MGVKEKIERNRIENMEKMEKMGKKKFFKKFALVVRRERKDIEEGK